MAGHGKRTDRNEDASDLLVGDSVAASSEENLFPFSFSEEEIKDILPNLPSIHAKIEEAAKSKKRKDLRDNLRLIAYDYINPNKYKNNICFWYIEAFCLRVVGKLPDSAGRKLSSISEFLDEFPEFGIEARDEQEKLYA